MKYGWLGTVELQARTYRRGNVWYRMTKGSTLLPFYWFPYTALTNIYKTDGTGTTEDIPPNVNVIQEE